jgi:hypothetical protein
MHTVGAAGDVRLHVCKKTRARARTRRAEAGMHRSTNVTYNFVASGAAAGKAHEWGCRWQSLVGTLQLVGLTSAPLSRQMQVGAATPSLQGVPRRVGARPWRAS